MLAGTEAQMDIDQISHPGDGRPGLLGIPRPVVPPCGFGPQGTEEHAEGEKHPAHGDEVVENGKLGGRIGASGGMKGSGQIGGIG